MPVSHLAVTLLALVFLALGHGAQAQSASDACAPGDPQAQSIVNATFKEASAESASGILGAEYSTHLRPDARALPVSDAECRALAAAMGGGSLDGRQAVFYRIETSGRQPHVFAAYAPLVLSDEPGVAEVGEDLVFVIGADYELLFGILAVTPNAF